MEQKEPRWPQLSPDLSLLSPTARKPSTPPAPGLFSTPDFPQPWTSSSSWIEGKQKAAGSALRGPHLGDELDLPGGVAQGLWRGQGGTENRSRGGRGSQMLANIKFQGASTA